MLLSRKMLQRILGTLWLIDGLLQLQPQMFTMNMVNGVMKPMLEGQPGLLEANLQWIVQVTTENLTAVNLLIAIVQIILGIWFIIGFEVEWAVIVSLVWALVVWYAGEGLSMLLTGSASILTGAPGAVVLYPLLGFAIWPRRAKGVKDAPTGSETTAATREDGLISRLQLRSILAAFWVFGALLQLQPHWWQPGQISGAISDMVGQGGLNAFLVDPILQGFSQLTTSAEIPLNIALIVIFLAIGIALFFAKGNGLRAALVASIVVSLLLWYFAQGFGMIFTGMATDFNSGLLLVVIALACWPTKSAFRAARGRYSRKTMQEERSAQMV
jgi:hypothetical protein